MNKILAYVKTNWKAFELDRLGDPSHLTFVVSTPRFRASRHVIFFILVGHGPDPILVAKVPRLPVDRGALDREAANLQAVQGLRPGGFESIPRVIAYEDAVDVRILLQSVVPGRTMRRALVARAPETCVEAGFRWIMDLHSASINHGTRASGWLERLGERPFGWFERVFPLTNEESELVRKTRQLARPLWGANLPSVFEHGDLSSPNILISRDGQLGVVDWEAAEPQGLVAADLFLFLAYIAFARHRAENTRDYVNAFSEAFFGCSAWARPLVMRYARSLGLPPELIHPLFILCWGRYAVNLLARLIGSLDLSAKPPDPDAVEWLRGNRYFALWRYAVENAHELCSAS